MVLPLRLSPEAYVKTLVSLLDAFIDVLGALGVAAVDYPAEELAAELGAAL